VFPSKTTIQMQPMATPVQQDTSQWTNSLQGGILKTKLLIEALLHTCNMFSVRTLYKMINEMLF
jgi:hypothetical protein